MRNKSNLANIIIDANYPYGRIKDNTGAGDGTPVNEFVYGDIQQFFAKLITLAGIVPNDLPDNEINQYQTIQALKEFASKNNYIQNISSVTGVLNVSAKLGLMNTDEFLVCKASVDLGVETQIKGTDGTTFTITTIGTFKTNEYVRLIKTASTIVLVRISDSASLDLMVSELLYLKKASQAQENAGTVDTFATTPLVNKVTFTRRVIGADSGYYLAKPTGDIDARNAVIIGGKSCGPEISRQRRNTQFEWLSFLRQSDFFAFFFELFLFDDPTPCLPMKARGPHAVKVDGIPAAPAAIAKSAFQCPSCATTPATCAAITPMPAKPSVNGPSALWERGSRQGQTRAKRRPTKLSWRSGTSG